MTWPVRQVLTGKGLPRRSKAGSVELEALEKRLDRLQAGWNHHVPSLLDSVSVALGEARAAAQVHDRIDAMREDLDRLALRVDQGLTTLAARLGDAGTDGSPAARPAPRLQRIASAAKTGLDLQFIGQTRPPDGIGGVSVGMTGLPEADFTLTYGAGLPFATGSVRSILVTTDCPIANPAELEAVLASWFSALAPEGLCTIERFYLGELLAGLSSGNIDPEEAQAIAGLRGFSSAAVSAERLAEALSACGYDKVQITRSGDYVVTVCGVRPAAARASR